jgi:protocatechuate 3,4-dioxygenase beta subunit
MYLLSKSEEFHLDSGQEASINLKLEKAPPLPCTELSGQVVSNCTNVQGATVKILGKNSEPVCHTETNIDGEFYFINTLIPGDYEIIVSAKNYLVSESIFVSLKPFAPLYVSINLKPDEDAENAILYGTVRNSENVPLPNVQVCIYSDRNIGCPMNITITNANGEYLFTGLNPGKYTISAFSYGYTLPKDITVEILPEDIFRTDIYLYRTVLVAKGTISGVVHHNQWVQPDSASTCKR